MSEDCEQIRQRRWLDAYQPNLSHLRPAALASEPHAAGRLQGQQPAGTYARRSIRKYAILMESFGLPDPFRVQHREALNQVIQRVVRERIGLAAAILELGLPTEASEVLNDMASGDLALLAEHNYARYRFTMQQTARWIADGRPR